MWPWEHAAVAYLTYSILRRAVGGRSTGWEALAVVFGSQFPDLVDKPMGWVVGVFPSGQSVAHSLLVAVPLSVTLVAVGTGRRRGTDQASGFVVAAFVVGYLSHIPGDVLYPKLLGRGLNTDFLLWPITPASAAQPADTIGYVRELFGSFVTYLGTPAGTIYLAGEALLLLAAVLVWRADGHPFPGRTSDSTR